MKKSERLAKRFLNDLHGIIVVAAQQKGYKIEKMRILAEEIKQAAAGLIELIDERMREHEQGDGK